MVDRYYQFGVETSHPMRQEIIESVKYLILSVAYINPDLAHAAIGYAVTNIKERPNPQMPVSDHQLAMISSELSEGLQIAYYAKQSWVRESRSL